jgi:hypothetical protein
MALPPPPLQIFPIIPPHRIVFNLVNFRNDIPFVPPQWAPMIAGDPRLVMFDKKTIDLYFNQRPINLRLQFSQRVWANVSNLVIWNGLDHDLKVRIVEFLENKGTYSELSERLPQNIMSIIHNEFRNIYMADGRPDPFLEFQGALNAPVNGVNVYNKYLKYKNKYLKLKEIIQNRY